MQEGSLMRFYTKQHRFYCGIDLHARSMYACVLNQAGQIVAQKNLPTSPEILLDFLEPYRPDVAIAVECMFSWYWLADLCARERIPFVLGHALYMKAIHGGKAKNDRIDAHKIAVLLRGGSIPQAYVYPGPMRSTRDLLRRRLYLVRTRGHLLSHIQNTNHQHNLPPFGMKLNYKTNRLKVAERFQDPSVHKSISVDLELLAHYDRMIRDLELFILHRAKEHDPDTFYRLTSIHGIGKVLALTILYEIHDISRFERVQDFVSYARLVKCAKESAGTRRGTGGNKIGNVHLKWAFSEAAVLFLKDNPAGQKYLDRLRKKHGRGKALSILAHKLGRTAYYLMTREKTFNMNKFLAA